jgi:hypothetical protein
LRGRSLETTLPIRSGARTVHITAHGKKLRIETVAGSVVPQLMKTVAHMFRLDEDLSGFYEFVRDDELAWCSTRRRTHAARADGVRGRRKDETNARTNIGSNGPTLRIGTT